jgi:hypothetical protein
VAPKEDDNAAAERKRKILEEAKAKLEAEQKAAEQKAADQKAAVSREWVGSKPAAMLQRRDCHAGWPAVGLRFTYA